MSCLSRPDVGMLAALRRLMMVSKADALRSLRVGRLPDMMMEVFGVKAKLLLLRGWSYGISKTKGVFISKRDRLLTRPSW
jgi:hypothetical protein